MKTKLRKKATGCTSRFFAVFSHITSATNIIIFFLIVLMMCYGCSKSTSPNEKPMITIEIMLVLILLFIVLLLMLLILLCEPLSVSFNTNTP